MNIINIPNFFNNNILDDIGNQNNNNYNNSNEIKFDSFLNNSPNYRKDNYFNNDIANFKDPFSLIGNYKNKEANEEFFDPFNIIFNLDENKGVEKSEYNINIYNKEEDEFLGFN